MLLFRHMQWTNSHSVRWLPEFQPRCPLEGVPFIRFVVLMWGLVRPPLAGSDALSGDTSLPVLIVLVEWLRWKWLSRVSVHLIFVKQSYWHRSVVRKPEHSSALPGDFGKTTLYWLHSRSLWFSTFEKKLGNSLSYIPRVRLTLLSKDHTLRTTVLGTKTKRE